MSNSDDMYDIHIDLPVGKGGLLSEIKSLTKLSPAPKKVEPEVIPEPLILSSLGKKKDKKNKKKRKGLEMNYFSSGDVISASDQDDEADEMLNHVTDDNLIDIDAILNDDDEPIDDAIIDAERHGYERLKKHENPYKKEFAEELTLLYNLLEELNKFSKDLDKKYKTLESSKVRGTSKYVNDLIMSILSAKTGKLQILKEISSLKKTVIDLKIKEETKAKAAQQGNTSDQLASSYFNKVLKFGRGAFARELLGGAMVGGISEDQDHLDEMVDEIESNRESFTETQMDNIHARIAERLELEGNPMRSDAGSKQIEYENLGAKIIIKRDMDSGEWDFVGVDRNNQVIYDYPVPNKRAVGKVRFSTDGRYATDELGRTYKVQDTLSVEDDD